MDGQIEAYFDTLGALGHQLEASDSSGAPMASAGALDWLLGTLGTLGESSARILFVGNGGSAAIASHMAIDFSKNGGFSALAFNDGAALTCLSNDLGYEQVFAKQVALHGRPGDLLFAISSSGNSANIIEAARTAREGDLTVVTLTGFEPDNRLRGLGDLNFYLPNGLYGFVEVGHLALCHAVLDIAMGWRADGAASGYAAARREPS